MKKISYSAWECYMTCGMKYYITRVLGWEVKQKSSALVFGSVIDDALNHLLETNDIEGAKKIFKDGIKCLYKSTDYYFFKGDFDYDLLTDRQIDLGLEYLKELDYEGSLDLESLHKALYKQILSNGNDYQAITQNQQLFLSCISTMSLKQKGLMMIDAYVEKVLPKINKVVSVQRATKLRPGFLDIEIDLKGHGMVTADHKTAGRMYDQSKIDHAWQLFIYDKEVNHGKVCYIVLGKTLRKNAQKTCRSCGFNGNGSRHITCPDESTGSRCYGEWEIVITPEIDIQVMVADVNKAEQETVLKSIESVEKAIDAKVFPMNLNSCPNQFGKPCEVMDFCRTGCTAKLQKRKERK